MTPGDSAALRSRTQISGIDEPNERERLAIKLCVRTNRVGGSTPVRPRLHMRAFQVRGISAAAVAVCALQLDGWRSMHRLDACVAFRGAAALRISAPGQRSNSDHASDDSQNRNLICTNPEKSVSPV